MSAASQPTWAQVSGPYPSAFGQGLKRGAWYEVLREDIGGMMVLDIDGKEESIHQSLLLLLTGEPRNATKLYGTGTMAVKEPGEPVQMMKCFAVCPKRHDLGEIAVSATRVFCSTCGVEYQLEDQP